MNKQVGIRELAEKAKKEGAFDLAQGIIDAPPPKVVVTALQKLSIENVSRYDNKRGVLKYREALVKYLGSRGWKVNVDQVLSVAGAMGGITSALLTELKPGAKVLLPEPFFVYHKLLLETLGFAVEYYKVPLDTQPDWKELEKKMSEAGALLLTTPANPTGQVASIEVLKKLSAAAKKKKSLLILDEMYREFIWDEEKIDDSKYQELDLSNTVVVRSFSKTFAVPGWRVGFAITAPERVERMAVQHDALYIGGSTIAQNAMAAALTGGLEQLSRYVVDLRQLLRWNMQTLGEAFAKYGFTPLPVPAAYYMLLKHNRENDIAAVEELIARKIVTTPVNILYAKSERNTDYIRIHFAVKSEATKEIVRILAR